MSEEKATQEEATAVTHQPQPTAIQAYEGGGLNLTTLEDMFRFAKYVSASGLAPKDMQKPETLLVAIEMGLEVGLPPMQAIQNIAVINGRPGLWGDAVPGLVRSSGKQEWYKQEKIGTPGKEDYGYKVTSKRKGDPNFIETTFTVADAKKASLWGKAGPWTFYPDRMLLNRARTFNARDNYPDVLKGLQTAEELQDTNFEVMESKPLTDGDKTNRLAEKLANKPEVEKVIEVMEEARFEDVPPEPVQPESRPESQPESTISKMETVAEPESRPNDTPATGQTKVEPLGKSVQVLLSKLGGDGRTMADLRPIAKALGIKLSIPQNLTEEEAKAILEKL